MTVFDLDGARTVITGAGGHIGQALVRNFAAAGAQVVACDVEGADLSAPGIAESHRFDLRDEAAILATAEAITAGGPPAVVISNAGWTRADTMDEVTSPIITDEMERNFTGAARLTRALLPAMREATGNRAFVFISSVNGLTHHGNPPYSAAKAALLAWMRAIAVEEGQYGIRANAVAPASVRTHAWDYRIERDPGVMDRLNRLYPLGRLVTVDEVARTALFLASPLASGITGSTLAVDAGLMAGNLPFLDVIR